MKTRIALVLITLLSAAVASVQSLHATCVGATITVDSTLDPTEAGKTTLRDALAAAVAGDIIDFSVTTPATITLDSGSGQLVVNTDVTICGPGPTADQLSVDGGRGDRHGAQVPGL